MKQRLGVSVVILFFLSALSRAQSPTAVVNGQVRDTLGAAIAGANVEVFNDATHVRYSTETNDEGIYSVPSLPPGTYHIQVSKPGFKTVVHPDITLNVQDAKAIGFTLPVGAISETVTVEGGAPLIDTQGAAVSTVVEGRYVENMPLNGRSFQDLIRLTPGVVSPVAKNSIAANGAFGSTGEFSVNGQRTESNVYTVDGVNANVGAADGLNMIAGAAASGSLPAATALGTTQALVSIDDLQEFRVQSSTYSAEYGRSPGGQFAFETKSGTNLWHGTAFDYLRNDVFDASDWFNDYFNKAKPPLRQNDFGGTVGGPVEVPRLYSGKDRTFFFASYEGLRLIQPQPAKVTFVPDAALIAATPAPLQQVLKAFPTPNGPDLGNGRAEFISASSSPSALDSTSVRFDHTVNHKLNLFFRFSDTGSNSTARGTGITTMSDSASLDYTARTYTAGASSALTSNWGNEFRLNYTTNDVAKSFLVNQFGGNTPVDLLQLAGLPPGGTASLLFFNGGPPFLISQGPSTGVQRQWNFVDSTTLSRGHHQLKVGIDYRRLTPVATPSTPANTYLYFSQNAIQTNTAQLALAQSSASASPLYEDFSAFVQDQWTVGRRLSLSFGARWEVDPAPGVTQGLMPYTVQGAGPSTWTLAPQGTPLWRTTWANLAPRLGAAYVLRDTPHFETVLRAGAGIFFDTGQQLGSLGFQGPGFSVRTFLSSAAFPLPSTQNAPAIINPPASPLGNVYVYPPDLQLPYTAQWNANIEQALGKSQALTVSYVGAHAAKLLAERQISGRVVGNPDPSTTFFDVENGLTSDYDALETKFQRRLSSGLLALGSYTWSHCMDYGSLNSVFSPLRGSCDFDVRHSLSGAFSYDVHGLGHHSFLAAITQHWGLDDRFTVRTGFPVILAGVPVPDPATGIANNSGMNLVPGQPTYIYGAQCAAAYNNGKGCPGGHAINPNAFSLPPGCTSSSCPAGTPLGNAPRNFVRGFGAWEMDLAIRREFPLYERLRLQFRAEALNVFNHPNFGLIDTGVGSPTFGQATTTLASSLGVLTPLYQMGGPRSLQLSLRLTF